MLNGVCSHLLLGCRNYNNIVPSIVVTTKPFNIQFNIYGSTLGIDKLSVVSCRYRFSH